MTNINVFEQVAVGELSAEQAAEMMMKADEDARKPVGPAWAPKWAWGLAIVVIGVVLSLFGIERRRDS